MADFQKVAAIDPYDADTEYFLGLIYAQKQDYAKAVAAFQKAIALNPFQVSAEFGLAQAMQRNGDAAHAKDHFERFQHMTAAKLGKPVSFIYGEQGKYSLAQIMQARSGAGASGNAGEIFERDVGVGIAGGDGGGDCGGGSSCGGCDWRGWEGDGSAGAGYAARGEAGNG